ncbi:MAG: hypothetical protein ACJA2Z_000135 [Candidatus Paceibacteria bacterium]|jgi:hypothetical protein
MKNRILVCCIVMFCHYNYAFNPDVLEVPDQHDLGLINDHHGVREYYAQCGFLRSCRSKDYHEHRTNIGIIGVFVHDAFIHPSSRMAYCYETCNAQGFTHHIHPNRNRNTMISTIPTYKRKRTNHTRNSSASHGTFCDCQGCLFRLNQELQMRRTTNRAHQWLNPIWSRAIWTRN